MNYEITPTKNNINLMISIGECEELLRTMLELDISSVTKSMKQIGKWSYELSNPEHIESVIFYADDLHRLLNASEGLYEGKRMSEIITKKTKFRVELRKRKLFWEIDND